MEECSHENTHCLNQYETFRKYQCLDCKKVFICSCEQELIKNFLPHQEKSGTKYGTQKEYLVNGYAKVCMKCLKKKRKIIS